MFWHFLKVVYSRACESRGVWIKVRKLKSVYHLVLFELRNYNECICRYDYDNKPLLKATITPSIYCLKYEQKGGSSLWRIF